MRRVEISHEAVPVEWKDGSTRWQGQFRVGDHTRFCGHRHMTMEVADRCAHSRAMAVAKDEGVRFW